MIRICLKAKALPLDEMMKRRMKRKAAFETQEIHQQHLKNALIEYLERLPAFQLREIIDIDIPGIKTELVTLNIYLKE